MAGCYSGLDGDAGQADGSAGDGGSGSDTGEDPTPDNLEPAPASLRLLLSDQYTRAVGDLLGDAAAQVATPPDDAALNGFDAIGAAQLALSDSAVDTYESSARAVALVAIEDAARIDALRGCTPTGPDDEACHRSFVTSFGRLAFRRPLSDIEVEQYTAVAVNAAIEYGDFDGGVETVIATLLQSPNFLYQVEVGEPDPNQPGMRRLDGYEMATRLSFFLAGTTPSADLIDDAEAGALDDVEGVRAAAELLLAETDAEQALNSFMSELLRLRDLDTLPKDPGTFPQYTPELAASMRQETMELIRHVAWENDGDFRDIFDADYTFIDARLAAHYGVEGAFDETFQKITLPAEQKRGGVLGHASVLALLGHVSSTSPTLRGKFIRETVLCQTIPAPPPDVATDLPSGETSTMRERLEQHMEDPSCQGCHALMDPIGFGLESYDGIGVFRTTENGKTIDASSELEGQPFEGAKELGAILKEQPSAALCLVRNLYRHATGHLETPGEHDQLELVADDFAASGYSIQEALVELVASPAFRIVGEPE